MKINMKRVIYILAILFLTVSCTKDSRKDMELPKAVALTTPSLQLSGISELSTRSDAGGLIESAELNLYVATPATNVYNPKGYKEGKFSFGQSGWTVTQSVTLNDGPGNYNAAVFAKINLKSSEGIPAIRNAVYAYRGNIEVYETGTFTPSEQLNLYSSAVQFILKDHEGNIIQLSEGTYLVNPIGLAQMKGFSTDFPIKEGEAIPAAANHPTVDALYLYGDYTPGTYPATWEEGNLIAVQQPATWKFLTITYCEQGFNDKNKPQGPYFVWNINYNGELKLEQGKLHTITVTLSNPVPTDSTN